MPNAAIAAIAAYFGTTAAVVSDVISIVSLIAVTAYSQDAQRKAQNQAADAYNASLRDRYVMVRGATEPRQIALGRVRVSGPMFFVNSYGSMREHLVICVALAAHQIDYIEQIYFDDKPVVLDGSGNVAGVINKDTFSISTASETVTIQESPNVSTVTAQAVYGTTIVPLTVSVTGVSVTVSGATAGVVGLLEIRYQPLVSPYVNGTISSQTDAFAVTAFTSGTFTATKTPITGSVSASLVNGSGDGYYSAPLTVSVTGTSVTVSGGPGTDGNVTIAYQVAPTVVSKARIRQYLGAPGQAADALMITDFPGVWTTAHTATGIAYLVVELDYDTTAFPGGIPNVSALIRGAQVYDPRTGTTAWTDNPALLMRHYAIDPNGGRLASSLIDDNAMMIAANACDTSTNYVVNGRTYTRALFKAGITAKSTARPQDALNALAQAMAGKWTFIDGLLRVHAGVYTTPVMTLDETWLADTQAIHIQPKRARVDVVNVVNATFADEQLNYQIAEMPRIAPATYITEDGTELPLKLTMSAIQFTGQAQHVSGCMLRDARKGMQLTVVCNMKAYPVELFDIINVTLSRFGWVNKTFEVFDVSWTLNGGIQLVLKETDATVYAVDAGFTAYDPSQASRLPSPWIVAAITSLTAASGTAELLKQADGTIQTRVLVTWGAILDQAVLSNGSIEVRYGLIDTPASTWRSVETQGADTQLFLTNVRDGGVYMIQARAKNALTFGQWCLPIAHKVVGKTALPINVAGFTAAQTPGGVKLSWTKDAEVDYLDTELHVEAVWNNATAPLFRGSANAYTWPWPAAGTYTVLAKHRDTSRNMSATASSVSITVDSGGLIQWSTSVTGAGKPADYATKNTVTYSAVAPVGPTNGDIWVDTSVVPNVSRYQVAGVWQIGSNYSTNTNQLTDGANLGGTATWGGVSGVSVTTGQIAANAATEIYVNTPSSSVTITAPAHTPDDFVDNTLIASQAFTPSASGFAQALFDGTGTYANSTGFYADARWSVQDAGAAYDAWKVLDVGIPGSASTSFSMHTSRSFAVTGGTTYTFGVYAHKGSLGDTFTVANMQLRIEVVKR